VITVDELKAAIKEVLSDEIKPFYVDRETHYNHHRFINELIEWSGKIKGTICGTLAKAITTGIIALIVLGFIMWGQKKL